MTDKKPEYKIEPIDENNPDGDLKISFGFIQDDISFIEDNRGISATTMGRVKQYEAGIVTSKFKFQGSKPLSIKTIIGSAAIEAPEVKIGGVMGVALIKTDNFKAMNKIQGTVAVCSDKEDALNGNKDTHIKQFPERLFKNILKIATAGQQLKR